MSSRNLPFVSNSPEVSGTITRFAVVRDFLHETRKLALNWVLIERVTGAALATPWLATFYRRDDAGHLKIVAAVEVSAADAVDERGAEGRELRFHVEVAFEFPLDEELPELEATIRRVEDTFRSPEGDVMGYADAPQAEPEFHYIQAPTPVQLRPRPAPAATESSESRERVDSAVFCPPTVGRAKSFLVQTFVYPPAEENLARERAQEGDAAAARRGVLSLSADVPLGTRIDLHLEMPALLIEEPDAVLIWRGALASAQFEVAVPADAPLGTTIGRIRFAIAGVPAGTLRFQVTVAVVATNEAARPAEVGVRRYRRAFVSYASKDRGEVLRRVQAFRIAGLSVFQDILDLEPGVRWERELYREIDNCDVLLLFWSTAAAASPWVAKEIDYALARKDGQDDRPPDIAPVPIEGPPIPPPPDKLRHLYFNDELLAHIAVSK